MNIHMILKPWNIAKVCPEVIIPIQKIVTLTMFAGTTVSFEGDFKSELIVKKDTVMDTVMDCAYYSHRNGYP